MKLCYNCGGDHFLDKCEKRPPHNSTNTKVMIAQASLPPQKTAFATQTKTSELTNGNNWEARGEESSVNTAVSGKHCDELFDSLSLIKSCCTEVL